MGYRYYKNVYGHVDRVTTGMNVDSWVLIGTGHDLCIARWIQIVDLHATEDAAKAAYIARTRIATLAYIQAIERWRAHLVKTAGMEVEPRAADVAPILAVSLGQPDSVQILADLTWEDKKGPSFEELDDVIPDDPRDARDRLKKGTRVLTVRPKVPTTGWKEALKNRRWDVFGEVVGHSDGHGLCYHVLHDGGGDSYYEPCELRLLKVPRQRVCRTLTKNGETLST